MKTVVREAGPMEACNTHQLPESLQQLSEAEAAIIPNLQIGNPGSER